MQYEFPHFTIDRRNFLKGSNTFEHYPDGEFLFSQSGYNTFSKPGLLANVPSYGSTVDGSLPIGIGISWAQGLAAGSFAPDSMVVGRNSSDDGTFWTMIESTGALTQVGSADTSHDYVLGKTDTVFYKGSFYTTSATDMTKNSVDLATRDTSWWVTTKSQSSLNSAAPHPQVVFGDIRYIADGHVLHQDDNGTVQAAVFDLGSDWVITALRVYNNQIYIAAEPYYNFSGTYSGGAKIFTWNGYSDSWLEEYYVGERINAFFDFKNVLYVWTPNYVGYFTGTTIDPLYPVNNKVTWSQIMATSDSMWYVDGTQIVRFGSPFLKGKKTFNRFFETVSAGNGLLSPTSEAALILSSGVSNGSNFYVADVNGTPSGNWSFRGNPRQFPKPVRIRAYVFHTLSLASGYVELAYYNDAGALVGTKRFTASDAAMINKSSWRFDVLGGAPTVSFDPYITIAGVPYLRSIDVLYEGSETKQNA